MKKIQILIVTALGLITVPALLAQGCSGPHSGPSASCCPSGHAAADSHPAQASPSAADNAALVADSDSGAHPALMEPVKSVFGNYFKIQAALAQDSMKGVKAPAGAIATSVRSDSMHMLSPQVAQQAEALAKAKDLKAARESFKALSLSLIEYLKAKGVPPGVYYQAYCPMAKASWLQTDKTIANPYMGKAMLRCGQIKS